MLNVSSRSLPSQTQNVGQTDVERNTNDLRRKKRKLQSDSITDHLPSNTLADETLTGSKKLMRTVGTQVDKDLNKSATKELSEIYLKSFEYHVINIKEECWREVMRSFTPSEVLSLLPDLIKDKNPGRISTHSQESQKILNSFFKKFERELATSLSDLGFSFINHQLTLTSNPSTERKDTGD
jgi:hypothetical protein